MFVLEASPFVGGMDGSMSLQVTSVSVLIGYLGYDSGDVLEPQL